MDKSESITALATALAKAQAEIRNAAKESENPHFRSRYADLSSVWEACRGPLTKHGLSVVQMPHSVTDETGKMHLFVRTLLLHNSGEWLGDTVELPMSKLDAQGVVACVTYGRRCGLAAIAGVAPGDDDDGETAVGRGQGGAKASKKAEATEQPPVAPAPPLGTPMGDIYAEIVKIAEANGESLDSLKMHALEWIAQEFKCKGKAAFSKLEADAVGIIITGLWNKFGPEPGSKE